MTLGYLQNNNLDFTLRHYFLRGLRRAGIILYTRQGGQRGRQASVECFNILQKKKICWFFAYLPSFSIERQCCFMQSIRKQTKWLTRILSSSKFGFCSHLYCDLIYSQGFFRVLSKRVAKGRGWREAIASSLFIISKNGSQLITRIFILTIVKIN